MHSNPSYYDIIKEKLRLFTNKVLANSIIGTKDLITVIYVYLAESSFVSRKTIACIIVNSVGAFSELALMKLAIVDVHFTELATDKTCKDQKPTLSTYEKPGSQRHSYPSTRSTHLPLTHSFPTQSSMLISHAVPVNPGKHSQKPPSLQSPF